MNIREALVAALRRDPELVSKVTQSLRQRIDGEEGRMASVVQAAEALEPVIEEALRKRPTRLGRLGLKSAHIIAMLAADDSASQSRLEAIAEAGTVGIVFVDVAGFTQFTAEHGDETAIDLLAELQELVDRAVKVGRGECVKKLGDGFLLAFPSASQAVRGAMSLRDTVVRRRDGKKGRAAHLRIAVHAGEPLVEQDDLLGHDVNLTARLLDHCEPDEIVISEPAKERAERRLRKVAFERRRIVKIKGLSTPVQVFSVLPAA